MKRSLFLLFVLLFFLFACASAENNPSPLYPIRENGLWGYMNRAGEIVIEPKWAYAEGFRGRYAVVYPGTNDTDANGPEYCGIIDVSGNWVLEPDYREILSTDNYSGYIGGRDEGIYIICNSDPHTKEGYAGFFDIPSGYYSGMRYEWVDGEWTGHVDPDLVCVTINDKKGFADRSTGEIVIPCQFSSYYYYFFNGDYCVVTLPDAGPDEWILIDRAENRIPLPENCYISSHLDRVDSGLIPIRNMETNLYGYMDPQGNIVIKPQYLYAYSFSEGLACVEVAADQFAMITPLNEIVFHRQDTVYQSLSDAYYSHGLIKLGMQEDGSILYADTEGHEAFRLCVDGLQYVSEFMENGLAFYSVKEEKTDRDPESEIGLAGLLNASGEVLMPPCYLFDFDNNSVFFTEGCMPVMDAETQKMGFIGKNGDWDYPLVPAYDRAEPFHNGLALVEKDGKFQYIDHEGNVVWQEK